MLWWKNSNWPSENGLEAGIRIGQCCLYSCAGGWRGRAGGSRGRSGKVAAVSGSGCARRVVFVAESTRLQSAKNVESLGQCGLH